MKTGTCSLLALIAWTAAAAFAGGTNETTLRTGSSDGGVTLEVAVEAGEHYRHEMRIMPLVTVKNPPQMAVWVETQDGEFLETLFVTSRTGRQDWRRAPGDSTPANRIERAEALPVWAHARGDASLRLPTREDPAPDAVTAATPGEGFRLRSSVAVEERSVVVCFEVNASTDFNAAFPRDAEPGNPGYSGGEWGSGQPSLVYRGLVTMDAGRAPVTLELVGHGSPDGSDGAIHEELHGITTAATIVESVVVTVGGEPRP